MLIAQKRKLVAEKKKCILVWGPSKNQRLFMWTVRFLIQALSSMAGRTKFRNIISNISFVSPHMKCIEDGFVSPFRHNSPQKASFIWYCPRNISYSGSLTDVKFHKINNSSFPHLPRILYCLSVCWSFGEYFRLLTPLLAFTLWTLLRNNLGIQQQD